MSPQYSDDECREMARQSRMSHMQRQIDNLGKTQQGWQCPNCTRCYSPLTPMCAECGPAKPPFRNSSIRAIQCESCGLFVRPKYAHLKCGEEGEPFKTPAEYWRDQIMQAEAAK